MSAEAAFASRTWSVGRYVCTLVVPRPKPGHDMHASIEWAPEQPQRLSDGEITEYRKGRNKALAEISKQLGINAAVVEL
jgi:hypothetical protein